MLSARLNKMNTEARIMTHKTKATKKSHLQQKETIMPIGHILNLPQEFHHITEKHKNIRLTTDKKGLAYSHIGATPKFTGRKVYHLMSGKPIEKKDLLSKQDTRTALKETFRSSMAKAMQDKITAFDSRLELAPLKNTEKKTIAERFTKNMRAFSDRFTKDISRLLGITTTEDGTITIATDRLNGKEFEAAKTTYSSQLTAFLAEMDAFTKDTIPPPKPQRRLQTTPINK